jgi:hypothetical protein
MTTRGPVVMVEWLVQMVVGGTRSPGSRVVAGGRAHAETGEGARRAGRATCYNLLHHFKGARSAPGRDCPLILEAPATAPLTVYRRGFRP